MDKLSKEKRSWNMGQIRSGNTKPEMVVRSTLHRMGFRFRLHRKDLPGKPDIVLPKHKTVIFVHGCFWHLHEACREGRVPSSNKTYWEPKLTRNVERDRTNYGLLDAAGWRVVVIWECETKNIATLEEKIKECLNAKAGAN